MTQITEEQITWKNIDPRVRSITMVGIFLAMLIACFDGTIVGTCGPVIAADLNGSDLYSWMVTAYLLCETIMIPIAGKLSDVYGRKPLFLLGLGLFIVGSILAGLSTSMQMLIVCRAIQGFGGGILIPVATASVADFYPPRDRARMQGMMGALFGIGSGVGPLIGGYITEAISWHWVFFINVPLAIVSILLTVKEFPKPLEGAEHVVDTRGICLLSVLLLDVLLFIELGGKSFEWVSPVSAIMIVLALVLLYLFVRQERRARDPVLAPHLLKNKVVVKSAVFIVIYGIGMMGAMTYASMFAIYIFGLTTLEAGFYSLAMVVGMMITSLVSGHMVNRTGYRVWLTVGPVLCFAGLYMMSTMGLGTEIWFYCVSTFVLGLGLGCLSSVIMTAVQNSSRPAEMGMTTSSVNLIRSIGSTMGTAIFAMIITAAITGELSALLPAEVFAMVPHDTGILDMVAAVQAGTPGYEQFVPYVDEMLTAFANSVDMAFLIGGVLLLLLVVVGLVFKVDPPSEELEA